MNFCALSPDFSSLAGSLSRFLPLILNYWYLADKISVIFQTLFLNLRRGGEILQQIPNECKFNLGLNMQLFVMKLMPSPTGRAHSKSITLEKES